MIRPTALLIAVLALFSEGAYAADSACEACSYSQMNTRAISLGKGDHRVYSLSTDVIEGFKVYCPGDIIEGIPGEELSKAADKPTASIGASRDASSLQGACPFNQALISEPRALAQSEIDSFSEIQDFYVANGNKVERIDVDMNLNTMPNVGYSGESVYNVLSDYQVRMNMYQWVLDNTNNLSGYLTALSAALASHFQIISNTIVIKITFKDNTEIKLMYDASTGQVTAIPNTAKNPDGSAIIEANSAGYQGNYFLTGTNINAYLYYLGQMGISVTNGGGTKLSCVWNPANLSITCTLMPN